MSLILIVFSCFQPNPFPSRLQQVLLLLLLQRPLRRRRGRGSGLGLVASSAVEREDTAEDARWRTKQADAELPGARRINCFIAPLPPFGFFLFFCQSPIKITAGEILETTLSLPFCTFSFKKQCNIFSFCLGNLGRVPPPSPDPASAPLQQQRISQQGRAPQRGIPGGLRQQLQIRRRGRKEEERGGRGIGNGDDLNHSVNRKKKPSASYSPS